MPIVSRFFGIVIALYWSDHAPPHFHAKYAGREAAIDIKTGAVVEGALSKRAAKLVEDWRRIHAVELMQDWNLAKQRIDYFFHHASVRFALQVFHQC